MNKRVEKLIENFDQNKIQALLIHDGMNSRYLSGFTGSSAYLYISNNKKVILTDFRYIEQAAKQCTGFEVVDHGPLGVLETIHKIIKEDQKEKIGFESHIISYNQYIELKKVLSSIELVETMDLVEEIRMIKDQEELENIKKAASIADQAFAHILSLLKIGMTEIDVALELEFFMKKNGASKLSFSTIVASGKNSSLPHAAPSLKKIEHGDFVTMDFGCVYKGYCSDMTRTVVVGLANNKQKQIYHTVLSAQTAALEILKEGLTGEEVDQVAREIINEAGYEGYFGHGLGHSVGLFIHENPRLSPKGKTKLQKDMIVTVEPGIYIPDFGGVRIEDLVCVTENGYENYTSSKKELIEL